MAFFKVKVERVNGNDFLAYAYRYDLLCQKASGYEMNVIFIGHPQCKKCKSIEYVKSLEEELKKQTLPFKSYPLIKTGLYFACACCYAFKILEIVKGFQKKSIEHSALKAKE
jgi:hypothetical protein